MERTGPKFSEAVFSKGDRRVAEALERAWQLGCRLDGWSEHFRFDLWQQAFVDTGLDPAFMLIGQCQKTKYCRDHLDPGLDHNFLLAERTRASRGLTTPDCSREHCSGCVFVRHWNCLLD